VVDGAALVAQLELELERFAERPYAHLERSEIRETRRAAAGLISERASSSQR